MRVLFEGGVWLSYSQMYLTCLDAETGYDQAFEGQRNALLGAGLPGTLTMMTGTHTGTVPLRVVLTDSEPELAPHWEDVVEASCTPTSTRLAVIGCTADTAGEFDLPVGGYRARYCATGLRPEGAPGQDGGGGGVERYELLLWPAPPAPDAVVRVGGEHTARMHRQLDPVAVAQDLEDAWDGNVPSERVRRCAEELARADRAFTDALDAAPAGVQRALACWSVDLACRQAGIADLDRVQEVSRTLHAGEPLPRWFRPDVVHDRLAEDPRAPRAAEDGDAGGQALFLVFAAVDHDAFAAAARTTSHLLWIAGDRAVQLRRAAGAELDRLLREAGGRELPDSRSPQACGYAEPEPDRYLGQDEDVTSPLVLEVVLGEEPEDDQSSPWSGPPPASPLERGFPAQVQALEDLAPGALQAVDRAQFHRRPAVLLQRVRDVCARAGVDDLAWVAAALRAAERGEPLPEPFASRSWRQALAAETGHEPRLVLVEGQPHERGVLALEALARWSAFRAWSNHSEAATTVLHALVFAVDDAERARFLEAVLDDLHR